MQEEFSEGGASVCEAMICRKPLSLDSSPGKQVAGHLGEQSESERIRQWRAQLAAEQDSDDDLGGYMPTNKRGRDDEPCMSPRKRPCKA